MTIVAQEIEPSNAVDSKVESENWSEYTRSCKLQWVVCAVVCTVYTCLAVIAVREAFIHFRGWALILSILAGLLLLKYVLAGGIFVVRRLFVWSRYRLVDGYLLEQQLFGKTTIVDLSEPHKVCYHFLFKRCYKLKHPYYQTMVIEQDDQIVRILPYHIEPPIDPAQLPEDVREPWLGYEGKHPWLVLPGWLMKIARQFMNVS